MRGHPRWAALGLLALACAADPAATADDGGSGSDGRAADAGLGDASGGPLEAGSADAGGTDAGIPAGPVGVLTGGCPGLDDAIDLPTPATYANLIDFEEDPYDDADEGRLSAGGRAIVLAGNAGGSSLLSEVFAFEVLTRCAGATLLETETTIRYDDPMSKRTDLLVEIDGDRVGVSVTRAVSFPRDAPYATSAARTLIERKLEGVLESSRHVVPEHRWVKQVLHVMADTSTHAATVGRVLMAIDPAIVADTVVMITVTEGDDAFIY